VLTQEDFDAQRPDRSRGSEPSDRRRPWLGRTVALELGDERFSPTPVLRNRLAHLVRPGADCTGRYDSPDVRPDSQVHLTTAHSSLELISRARA